MAKSIKFDDDVYIDSSGVHGAVSYKRHPASDILSAFPLGINLDTTTGDNRGYPFNYAVIVTVNVGTNRGFQICTSHTGIAYIRIDATNNNWTEWKQITNN